MSNSQIGTQTSLHTAQRTKRISDSSLKSSDDENEPFLAPPSPTDLELVSPDHHIYSRIDSVENTHNNTANGDNNAVEIAKMSFPRAAKSLPWLHPCHIVTVVEFCERVSYYGLSSILMNYMAFSPDDRIPGLLGLGSQKAAVIGYFFQFWCYLCPLLGAWLSDQYWGKYTTIRAFCLVYLAGILLLVVSSLSPEAARALPFFAGAIILIGLGTGGVKANVSPLVADCLHWFEPYTLTVKGTTYTIDHATTLSRVFLRFYLAINVGSLAAVITTLMEAYLDFTYAFLVPLVCFFIGMMIFVKAKHLYVHNPPTPGAIGQSFKILAKSARVGFANCNKNNTWPQEFVEDVRKTVSACKVCIFLSIYWAVYGQMLTNFITQASEMELHGIPNDILQNIDPFTIITFIPLFDNYIYPFLRRHNLEFRPVQRIFAGFVLASLAMFYTAIIQAAIYSSPPCYNHPLCSPYEAPNQIHVLWQAPAYFLIAISEILASVTALEFAYNMAPKSMRSFVMSLFLLSSAAGSVLGMIISPLARHPYMVIFYCALGVLCLASGWMLRVYCGHFDGYEAVAVDDISLDDLS